MTTATLERKTRTAADGRSITTQFRLADSGVENQYGEMEYVEFELSVSNYKERKRNNVQVFRLIAGPTFRSFVLHTAAQDCPFVGYYVPAPRHSAKALEALHAEALAAVEAQLDELAEWALKVERNR